MLRVSCKVEWKTEREISCFIWFSFYIKFTYFFFFFFFDLASLMHVTDCDHSLRKCDMICNMHLPDCCRGDGIDRYRYVHRDYIRYRKTKILNIRFLETINFLKARFLKTIFLNTKFLKTKFLQSTLFLKTKFLKSKFLKTLFLNFF